MLTARLHIEHCTHYALDGVLPEGQSLVSVHMINVIARIGLVNGRARMLEAGLFNSAGFEIVEMLLEFHPDPCPEEFVLARLANPGTIMQEMYITAARDHIRDLRAKGHQVMTPIVQAMGRVNNKVFRLGLKVTARDRGYILALADEISGA